MKKREVTCAVCGARFTSKGSCAKYCDGCRKKAHADKRKNYQVKLLADTEEMRQMCLNCTKLRCGGECEELARVARGGA